MDRIGVGTVYVENLLGSTAPLTPGTITNATVTINSSSQIVSITEGQRAITYVIDGGGSAIGTGFKGQLDLRGLPALAIDAASLLADQSGSCVIDIGVVAFGSYAGSFTGSITASDMPTLSSAVSYVDTTLTGWTKTVPAGSVLLYNVVSASTIERLTITLGVTG